jgi:formylmethanofuran dehydrogenase subunit B
MNDLSRTGQTENLLTCLGCNLLCDDPDVSSGIAALESNLKQICPRGADWLMRSQEPIELPERSLEHQILEAITWLQAARAPLWIVDHQQSLAASRSIVATAEKSRGILVSPASPIAEGASRAASHVGQVVCSLGDVRSRADTIILWGCDPASSHPRLIERLGHHDHQGTDSNRSLQWIVVGDISPSSIQQLTASGQTVRHFPWGKDLTFSKLQLLRSMIRQKNQQVATSFADASVAELAELLSSTRYGILFFGEAFCQPEMAALATESLQRLVIELNDGRAFHSQYLANSGDFGMGSVVCTWQTGYTGAISFQQGQIDHDGNRFAVERLLREQSTDCLVLVGDHALEHISQESIAQMAAQPVIWFRSCSTECSFAQLVDIRVQRDGIDRRAVFHRLDQLTIPARPWNDSSLPDLATVLDKIWNGLSR